MSGSRSRLAIMAALMALCGGCQNTACNRDSSGGDTAPASQDRPAPGETTMAMTIHSSAFQPNQAVPVQHTGDGADRSPPLTWSAAPEKTREFALICDDPDAPSAEPWVHWVIYKIPANTTMLAEGLSADKALPFGALQGQNSWKTIGYRGPAPPKGHGMHHYHFKLYALDSELKVTSGLTKNELLAAMRGHILAEAETVGTYQR